MLFRSAGNGTTLKEYMNTNKDLTKPVPSPSGVAVYKAPDYSAYAENTAPSDKLASLTALAQQQADLEKEILFISRFCKRESTSRR